MESKKTNWVRSIWLYSLLLLMLSFSLDSRIQAKLLIPFFAVSLALWIIDFSKLKNGLNPKLIFLFGGMFLCIGLSSWLNDPTSGWQYLERNLAFVAFPLAMVPAIKLKHQDGQKLFYAYEFGILLISCLCLANAGLNSLEAGSTSSLNNDPHFSYNFFMSHLLTEPFGIHPIYFSLTISLGSGMLLLYLLKRWSELSFGKMAFGLVLLALHLVMIYLLKSAIFGLLYFMVIGLVVLSQRIKSIRQSKSKSIAAAALLLIFALVAIKFSYSKLENFNLDYELSDRHQSTITIRLAIWECTLPLIQENIWLGVGPGNAQPALNQAYEQKGFAYAQNADFEINTHNQYLQFLLNSGLFQVSLFIVLLLLHLLKSLLNRNVISLAFGLCFALFCITESTLQVQRGILFFTILISLFAYQPKLWKFNLE